MRQVLFPALFFSMLFSASAAGGGGGSYAVQPFVFPSTPSSTVIPAFPEQSDISGPCPLDLPDDLFTGISHACSDLILPPPSSSTFTPPSSPTARLRCCPALAAYLYTAHSSAALQSTHFIPTTNTSTPSSAADLPVLPDDSEACAETAEKALRLRGVALGRANESCGAVYCYCGIRLRPLSCPGGIRVEKVLGGSGGGGWVAADEGAKMVEKECGGSGVDGCSRCLQSLYQLNRTTAGNNTSSGGKTGTHHPISGVTSGGIGDCELMGLTWLLASNRTRYLPIVTRVLRTLMFSPSGPGSSPPTSCSDSFPLAVGSAELDGDESASSAAGLPSFLPAVALVLVLLGWV